MTTNVYVALKQSSGGLQGEERVGPKQFTQKLKDLLECFKTHTPKAEGRIEF